MSVAPTTFYVTGGTLPPGTSSYVPRQADKDLYEGLLSGEFCYVLTSRQMGKSSLMAQTTARLREAGVAVVNLDLTRLGQNLTVEQWYDGLLGHLGRQLDLEDELEEYWLAHERLSPLQRWLGALQAVVLPAVITRHSSSGIRHPTEPTPPAPPLTDDASRMTIGAGRLVIAIDEIDTVRSLSFSTDEFFAAIRDCYNRRSHEPEFQRLTFCLLGVASPSDLIQDTRTTPFNIGKRIELTDFTPAEAAPLAQGMGRDQRTNQALLQQVLYWTEGHPYLTQRLCQTVAQDETVTDPAGVDRHCEALFLSPQAQERDDNLLFVRERLLKSEADRASLLDLYGQVRSRKRVLADDTNQLVSLLRLSGIVRVAEARSLTSSSLHLRRSRHLITSSAVLRVRNRIYERVFDREWVAQHMPDAELRRQRVAYRRGLLRATAVSVLILAVIAGLALTALQQAHNAEAGQRVLRRTLYAADMSLADQAWEAGNLGLARELLEAHRPERDREELRGFEWRYLWRRTRGDELFALRGHTAVNGSVVFSPDGRLLISGSFDKTMRLWDLARRRQVGTPFQLTAGVRSMAVSRDSQMLATGLLNGTLMLWEQERSDAWGARRLVATRQAHSKLIRAVSFSPDGRLLVTAGGDGTLKLWSVPACRVVAGFRSRDPRKIGLDTAVFAPDGKLVAIKTGDGLITLWEVATRRVQTTFQGFTSVAWCMTFSPDGTSLAAGNISGDLRVWDLAVPGGRPRLAADVVAHTGAIFGVAFSPDGTRLATASADNLVKLWAFAPARARRTAERTGVALPALQLVDTLRGHIGGVGGVAFSPDGKMLATGGMDAVVRLWETDRRRETETLKGPSLWMDAVALSADGQLLAAGNSGRTVGAVRLWELAPWGGRPRRSVLFRAHGKEVRSLALSPDGKILATASEDQTVRLWDVANRPLRGDPPEIGTLRGHQGGVNAVAFSPDGKTLATGGDDRTVRLWEVASRRQICTLRGHTEGISSVAFSPDGRTLASGSSDQSVRLWRLALQGGTPTPGSVTVYPAPDGGVNCVACSPDGRLVASGNWNGTVRLWHDGGKQAPIVLRGHQFSVTAVAFSADGKTLASSSEDFTLKLWNLTTGRGMATLKGHRQGVSGLAFSADGSLLVSGSTDGTVRLWRAATFPETDGPGAARLHPTSR